MAFSICYWANYTQVKTKLSWKSENAVADDRVLKFLYDADLRHVEFTLNLDTLKLTRNIKKCEMKSANKPVL